MGEGMAWGGLPFPDTGCPALDLGNKYYLEWNIPDTISIFLNLPRMFLSTNILFEQRI